MQNGHLTLALILSGVAMLMAAGWGAPASRGWSLSACLGSPGSEETMKTYVIISRAPKFRRCGILFTQAHPRVVSEAEVTPEILAEPMLHVVELDDGRASEPPGDGTSVQAGPHGHSAEGVSSDSGKAGPRRRKRSISRRGKSEEVSS